MKYIGKVAWAILVCSICYLTPVIIERYWKEAPVPLFMFWGGMTYMFLSRFIMEDK